MSAADRLDRSIAADRESRGIGPTEAEHQAQVIELAHMLGWHHLHVRRSIGKGRTWVTATNIVGWPDLVLFRPADDGQQHLIFAELKSESGKLTPEQEQVLDDLRRSGCEVHVWRPSDMDAIAKRLGDGRASR